MVHEAVTGNVVVGHQSSISRCDRSRTGFVFESRVVAKNRRRRELQDACEPRD